MGMLSRFFRNLFKSSNKPIAPSYPTKPSDYTIPEEKPIVEPPVSSNDLPEGYLDTVLDLTGSFEGSAGFGQVTGDFDGQGLSCGILQWCYGQGSLQNKILQPYLKFYGAENMDKFFPFPVSPSASMGASQAINYTKNHMLDKKEILNAAGKVIDVVILSTVKTEWKLAWKSFLKSEAVIQLQKEAATGIALRAYKLAKDWEMPSLRTFCWMFDILTQGGSLKIDKPKADLSLAWTCINQATEVNKNGWSKIKLTEEKCILLIASYQRAKISNPKYFLDVFGRKGTIAMGKGFIHREFWDLDTKYFDKKV